MLNPSLKIILRLFPFLLWLLLALDLSGQQERALRPAGAAGAERSPSGRDYALLVGIDEYDHWENLVNAKTDVQAVGRALEELYGFEVETLLEPTRCELLMKLREYYERSFTPEDQLLIMFAGHGIFDKYSESGYFVTREALPTSRDPTFCSYLPYPLRLIDRISAGRILLVVDACFGGTLDPRIASRGPADIHRFPSDMAFLAHIRQLRTRRYIASAGKETISDGCAGCHSPFARALLEGLRSLGGPDGILTLDEWFSNYLQKVDSGPVSGEFGSNEPGSSFALVLKGNPARGPEPVDVAKTPRHVSSKRFFDAQNYCLVGGAENIEEGIRIFHGLLKRLPAQERALLDQDLLRQVEVSLHQGTAPRTCLLFRSLFHRFYDTDSGL